MLKHCSGDIVGCANVWELFCKNTDGRGLQENSRFLFQDRILAILLVKSLYSPVIQPSNKMKFFRRQAGYVSLGFCFAILVFLMLLIFLFYLTDVPIAKICVFVCAPFESNS